MRSWVSEEGGRLGLRPELGLGFRFESGSGLRLELEEIAREYAIPSFRRFRVGILVTVSVTDMAAVWTRLRLWIWLRLGSACNDDKHMVSTLVLYDAHTFPGGKPHKLGR